MSSAGVRTGRSSSGRSSFGIASRSAAVSSNGTSSPEPRTITAAGGGLGLWFSLLRRVTNAAAAAAADGLDLRHGTFFCDPMASRCDMIRKARALLKDWEDKLGDRASGDRS